MFNFIKGKQNHTTNKKSINANDVLLENQKNNSVVENQQIKTKLSIPDDWNLSEEDRYVYAFHNSQAPPLKVSEISIYKIEITRNEKSIIVTGLIRNAVPKPIHFNKTDVSLVNDKGESVSHKAFDLSGLGTIPPNSARPWRFEFEVDKLGISEEELIDDWSLAFVLIAKQTLDLEISWEKSIADESREKLEEIVETAPPLKPGEINLMGIEARVKDDGNLLVTVLFRNGSDKNMELSQIPLAVADANNEEIVRGTFKLNNFTVKANTSKPWSFIFPKSKMKKKIVNLSKWRVYPLQ